MAEEYYDATVHGLGIEGFVNYSNLLVDGWMATFFIAAVFIMSFMVGSKSEWKRSNLCAFNFLLCLITSMILSLFTVVNPIVTFVCIFGLGASIFWMVVDTR